jgi:predicted nuclease of predicted toxin-antitoxin system
LPTKRSRAPRPDGSARLPIKFFTDHNVPDSVGRKLAEAGHKTVLLRERLAPNAPDPLVAAFAEMFGAVLVSFDHDFKTLAPRAGVGKRRFQKLSRIALRCFEPERRIECALSLIEHEWSYAQNSHDKRMIVEIGRTYIRTIR